MAEQCEATLQPMLQLQRTVAQMNVERFELMLITETDRAKRQTLFRLLREQQERLALLSK